jgi:hypothetical protein
MASRLSPLASRLSPLASRLSPLACVLSLWIGTGSATHAVDIHVRDYGPAGPPPTADGSTWATAFGTIEQAIALANALTTDDRILIGGADTSLAGGRAWKPGGGSTGPWAVWPGPGTPPATSSSFVIGAGSGLLRIEGGYPVQGGNAVDYALHPTVLSGDLGGDDPSLGGWESISAVEIDENAFHVVTILDNDDIILDGFTIERGNGDDDRSDVPDGFQTGLGGGGVFLTGSTLPIPGFPDCNPSVLSFAQATILNCTIQLNTGLAGAGIAASRHWPIVEESSIPVVTVRNSIIRANRSTDRGGGIAIGYGLLDIAGSIVAANRAVPTGGGIWLSGKHPPPPCSEPPCFCPQPPPERETEPAGAVMVHCTIADNEVTGSSGAGIAWEDLAGGSPLLFESCIVATNRVDFTVNAAWTDSTHQYSSEAACGTCVLVPELVYSATPTGQGAFGVPTPLTYDIRDPHFLNAGPWISFSVLDPLSRTYEVHPCSFARDLGQPDTALLPRDLFDVNHNGITTGELLPDVVWNDRVQVSGFWPPSPVPLSPPGLRSDIGALEHSDPGDCYFDMAGPQQGGGPDGVVGPEDLAVLLGLWTSGPNAPFGTYTNLCLRSVTDPTQTVSEFQPQAPRLCTCIDRDRDGIIGAAELAGLLGAWGGCPGFLLSGEGGEGMMSESLAMPQGLSPTALADLFGFATVESFADWVATLSPAARSEVLGLLAVPSGGV